MRLRHLAPCLLVLAGCATTVPQRFSQEVAASFAREDMRRMETAHLELYYPARHKEAALRIGERLEQCAEKLRAFQATKRRRDKLLVFLTTADFNNAYVQPIALGNPQQMVLPLHMSLDSFDLYDIGTNAVGDVSCHEATHYMTMEQIEGFWRGLNAIFGGLISPQSFLDGWFHEGTSTYYEGRLGKPVGRPFSPFWRNAFTAGVASEEGLDAGFLNDNQRLQDPYGSTRLTGLMFVEWLAQKYGEAKLWKLVDKQARSIFSPFGVTLRFKSVYGLSIGALFDEFVAETKKREVKRARPEGQRAVAKALGHSARLAVAPDGTIATLTSDLDEPSRLAFREKDGKERASRRMTDVLPFRGVIVANPIAFSGLSFSPDSRWLYMVGADLAADGSFKAKLWQVDARDASVERTFDDLEGLGGCATSEGGYVYVGLSGERASLVRLDLKDGARRTLYEAPPGVPVSAPACAPDGLRVAFAQRGDRGLDLWLREADGAVVRLTEDGRYNTQPRWLDARRLLFVREAEGGRAQAFVLDVTSKALWATTDAPYGVFDPTPFGQLELAFLNREGWGFSLDTAPLALVPAAGAQTTAAPVPEADLGAGFLAAAAVATDPAENAPGALARRVEPAAPLKILEDKEYSPIDGLFVPGLRVPYLMLTPGDLLVEGGEWRLLVGLGIQGSDRLGKHAWAINVSYDTHDKLPSAAVGYGNYQLAPYYVDVQGALVNLGRVYDKYANIGVSRTFWTSPVRLQIAGIDHYDVAESSDPDSGVALGDVLGHYRFVGPGLQFAYLGAETTPYGGIRRGVAFSGVGNVYPKFAASDFTLGDVGAQLDVWLPLPISKRHSFSITGRGRALLAAQPASLLQVGGFFPRGSELTSLLIDRLAPTYRAADQQFFSAPQLTFGEVLRGYPDLGTSAAAYAAGSASYTYPFIVEHGWASLLYVLPAFFIRQIDLELYGELAYLWPGRLRRSAAGAAVHFRANLGNLPLTLFAEGTWRFDEHRDPLIFFGFAYE